MLAGPVTKHALYTLSKYLLPPTLGFVLALRTAGSSVITPRPLLEALGRARLGLVIAFMSALPPSPAAPVSVPHSDANP